VGDERWDQVARGLYQFSLGLSKKVLLADSFARVADLGFAAASECSTLEAWAFSVAYSLQIYFDFSGYSDMAIGSALILGIEIPRNFNSPYRSKTVIEFWQRWHISLSTFITTYLYTPILRSFKKATLTTASVATLLSMTIAGLWHGPSWNFILFGMMHGAALVLNQYWKKKKLRKLPPGLAWALTFCFVNLAFIFFRAPDLTTAAHLVALLVPRHGALGTTVLATVPALGVAMLVPPLLAGVVLAFFGKSSDELQSEHRPSYATSLGTVMMILTSLLYMNSTIVKQFVYFNF
jgi:alginate O-acetyltransferase complex protein AlgI